MTTHTSQPTPGTSTDTPDSTSPPPLFTTRWLPDSATATLLLTFWLWWLFTFAAIPHTLTLPYTSLWSHLFTLTPTEPLYLWTWLTSIFTHGNLPHLLINSVVFLSFGIPVERLLGRRRFLSLFFITAFVASFLQVLGAVLANQPMHLVGASGAITGLVGALSVYRPDATALLFFIIPLPMWLVGTLITTVSAGAALFIGIGSFGLAHLAHAGGALMGIIYASNTTPRTPAT